MTTGVVRPRLGSADLVVVGAGIVGLAHALHAIRAGASVMVLERADRAVGASVRNFGHVCITAQDGEALAYGLAGRDDWLRVAKESGAWLQEAGTVVVARDELERTVLEDFAQARPGQVELLDAAGVARRVPFLAQTAGGAWFPLDLRVDPRDAAAALTRWLGEQGVVFHWCTSVLGVEDTTVRTTRGDVAAGRVVVAVGHDVDHLYPDVAEQAGLVRCSLHMLGVAPPAPVEVEPAVLTGTSMLRYPGFAVSPALEALREQTSERDPAAVEAVVNLMFTQRPDKTVLLGDTHTYATTPSPFQDEAQDLLLLRRARALFGGVTPVVRERWQGVYASAPDPYLVATPAPEVRIVSVTSGIGMTTAFGLAARVLPDLLA